MTQKQTQARLKLNEHTVRVLDVVKGKFGLKNRSEALNKFAEEEGIKYVEPKIDESILKELDETYEKHKYKYGDRSMSLKELDELLGW